MVKVKNIFLLGLLAGIFVGMSACRQSTSYSVENVPNEKVFENNTELMIQGSFSIEHAPYDDCIDISDNRDFLEENMLIPTLSNTVYPEFEGILGLENGEENYLKLSWYNNDDFHNIEILVMSTDAIDEQIDVTWEENGHYTEIDIDGVRVKSMGVENSMKIVSLENKGLYYRICSSYADSYETTVDVLKWLIKNPLELGKMSEE